MRRMSMLLVLGLCTAAVILGVGSAHAAGSQLIGVGTGVPQTGPFTQYTGGGLGPEFAPAEDEEGPLPFGGTITGRSLSKGNGNGKGAGKNNGKGHSKSNPSVVTSFEGLNHYQQRYARGGNQFSLEPPDQGLCAGNGDVLEVVNDVLNVYNSSGTSVLPDNTSTNIVAGFPRNVNHAVDLSSFFNYPPAINRTTGIFGPEPTDPSCLYDSATQRWFLVMLALERVPTTGALTHVNHIDIAVSKTSDPTGSWNLWKLDTTNDGTQNPSASNACPCLADYPHIGADANGFYVTTNAYPWNGNGFNGAQIYAFSKADLVAGVMTPRMQHIDTWGMVDAPSDAGSTQPGFTVWPAEAPNGQFDTGSGGTEYFLSSNAADEAQKPVAGSGGPGTSDQLVVWTLTNTSSLNSSPALKLSSKVIDNVEQYAIPPKQQQAGAGGLPGTDVPQGLCLNDSTTLTIAGTGCWPLLVTAAAHTRGGTEHVSTPDSNDTRMQQVMYANGKLWGALDTAVTTGSSNRAGVAYFVVNPSSTKVMLQGYLASGNADYTYPAVGVMDNGRGVMAFTVTGDGSPDPGAGYASLDAKDGVGDVHVIAPGAAPDDGFTGYGAQVAPIRPRWGDYGAAVVDGNSFWIASEYIAGSCSYTNWGGPFFIGGTGDNLLGTCGGASHGPGPRTALANWSTRITELTP
jgi:hypothetical protein